MEANKQEGSLKDIGSLSEPIQRDAPLKQDLGARWLNAGKGFKFSEISRTGSAFSHMPEDEEEDGMSNMEAAKLAKAEMMNGIEKHKEELAEHGFSLNMETFGVTGEPDMNNKLTAIACAAKRLWMAGELSPEEKKIREAALGAQLDDLDPDHIGCPNMYGLRESQECVENHQHSPLKTFAVYNNGTFAIQVKLPPPHPSHMFDVGVHAAPWLPHPAARAPRDDGLLQDGARRVSVPRCRP